MDAFLLAAKFLLPLYYVRLFQEIASYLLCVYEEPLQNIEINIGFIQPSIGWVSLAGYKPGFDDIACLRIFSFLSSVHCCILIMIRINIVIIFNGLKYSLYTCEFGKKELIIWYI